MELREKIARALFAHETHGLSPPDAALDWDKDGHAWLGFADVVLEIPEIRGALASVALLEGERKMFANYRADMGRLINGNDKA